MKKLILFFLLFWGMSAIAQTPVLLQYGVVDSTTYLPASLAAATYNPIITAANSPKYYFNGYKKIVGLSTDSIAEGTTNLFFTAARAAAAVGTSTWSLTGNSLYNRSKFIGSIDTSQFRVRTNNIDRFVIDSSGNAAFSFATLTATATPFVMDFGGTYGSSTAGSAANLKWKMFNDGTPVDSYGLGMSAYKMEYQIPTLSSHVFYVAGTEVGRISSTGFTTSGSGSFAGLTNTGTLTSSGNASFGNTTSAATATPFVMDFGGTYGTSTAGSAANLKWKMFNDGTPVDSYGLGMSSYKMEYQIPTLSSHVFYVAGTEVGRISSTGFTTSGSGSFAGLTNTGTLTSSGRGSFVGLTNTGTLTSSGNATFSNTNSTGTATPFVMDFGGTYGTSTPGSAANLKLKMYNDGTAANSYGLGVGMSSYKMEYQVPASASHVFYVAGTEVARIGSAGLGIGITSPSALLHLGAGTTAKAPLRFQGGVTPTAPNNGDVWFDSTVNHLSVRMGGTSYQLDQQSTTNTSAAFTPAFTNSTNISSSTLTSAYYTRVGYIVHIRIAGTISATTTTSATQLTFSLPFTPSNTSEMGSGMGEITVTGGATPMYSIGVVNQFNSSTMALNFTSGATAAHSFVIDATYQINNGQ